NGENKGHLGIEAQLWVAWKLARMNLALRGINANLGQRRAESFRANSDPDLKAGLVPVRKDLANPPFNMSDWGGENLRQDSRWKFGMRPVNKANYASMQPFTHHISPVDVAGLVAGNGKNQTEY